MYASSRTLTADDGTTLFVRRWIPDAGVPVHAVVQIAHGMAEHSARYADLAGQLCKAGFEVWANDHRGHGPHCAKDNLGHPADDDGFFQLVRDMKKVSEEIARELPGKPLFLLGHSWGSFLAQGYIERWGDQLAGCALSGTRGPGGFDVSIGAALASAIAFFGGPKRHSPLMRSMADGPLNTRFRPNRTDFDWLSRDTTVVDAYVEDPLCGFPCSVAYYRDLAKGLLSVHSLKNMSKIPKELPVFVFVGASDPVGLEGRSPAALVESYRSLGIRDLEFTVYPDARHETLNETNKEEVISNLLLWLKRLAPAA
jgi:alpha-beta hydrolase superfamily lysophospholipase